MNESEGRPGQPEQWVRSYIGLGSNEGNRLSNVQQAMQLLKDHNDIEVVECSSLYETEPVGNGYEEWFVNAVSAIETKLSARELLEVCRNIEQTLCRLNGSDAKDVMRQGADGLVKARIIDLDILFYGDEEINTSYLKVPPLHITRRAYSLVPLLEIAPDLVHPVLKCTVTTIHERLPAPEQVFLFGTRDPVADVDIGIDF